MLQMLAGVLMSPRLFGGFTLVVSSFRLRLYVSLNGLITKLVENSFEVGYAAGDIEILN